MSEAKETNVIELNETIELDDSENISNASTEILPHLFFSQDHSDGSIWQKSRRKHFPTPLDFHYERSEELGELNKDANVEYEVVSSEMTGTITFSNVCIDLQQKTGPFSGMGEFRYEICQLNYRQFVR